MRNKPNDTITIDLETYPLFSAGGAHYATTFPTVHVEGKPIISIEHLYGTPRQEAVDRAAQSVRSFLKSGKQYSTIPDDYYADQVQEFDLETLDLAECEIEVYGSHNDSHLVIRRERQDKPYLCFCIWDFGLQGEVLKKLSKEQLRRYGGLLEDYRARLLH